MTRTRSAGGVVLNAGGQVLVVNQRGRSWSLPKGRLEAGEDALQAARREIAEETGVSDLSLLGDLGEYERFRIGREGGEDPSELKAIRMFLFSTRQEALEPRDPDHPEARWVDRDAVAALLTHPRDRAFFLSVLGRIPV